MNLLGRLEEAEKEFAQVKELFERRSAELEITRNEKEAVEVRSSFLYI